MKTLNAKLLDSTHLESKQPILSKTYVPKKIDIDEGVVLKESATRHFLESYVAQDDIYDQI